MNAFFAGSSGILFAIANAPMGVMAMEKPKLDLKAALAELKTVMLNPDPVLKNPYQHYTYQQLEELLEEICDEFDRLPPMALGKITELQSQMAEIRTAIEIKQARGDES